MKNRQRLVYRLDMLFFISLLITSGLAVFLFFYQYYFNEDEKQETEIPATSAVLPSPTATNTLTLTATSTSTPTDTATWTAVPTLTATATFTLTLPPLVIAPLPVDEIQVGELLTITGNAQPGTTITLYDGDEIIGEISAGSNGDWSITLPDGLEEGPHELSIQAVSPDGTSSQQAPIGFEVSNAPTPTFTPLPSDTSTPTQTPIPTATATIIPSKTPQPTVTPRPTQRATDTPTQTPIPTVTATIIPSSTPQPTVTPRPTQRATETPTRTPIPTATATIIPSRTPQPTVTPRPTQRETETSTQTPIPTATATIVPSRTPQPTVTPRPTQRATETPTRTPIPTATIIPSRTPQPTATPSPTQTVTQRPSLTPVSTLVAMVAPSSTPQLTDTPRPTQMATETPTATFPPIPPSKTPILPSPTASRANDVGQLSTSTPALVNTEAVVIRPRIDAPANGETYAPGTIPIRGTGQPGAIVEIIDQDAETILAAVPIAPDGSWETSVVLEGMGKKTLAAAITAIDGTRLLSDPVQITLAPPVQPQTGLTDNPDETGRTFTALLALLLAAGGFSAYFAGRLLYLVAHDRLKPR